MIHKLIESGENELELNNDVISSCNSFLATPKVNFEKRILIKGASENSSTPPLECPLQRANHKQNRSSAML